MVSDFFLNITAGLVTQYGLSAEALLVIVALFVSFMYSTVQSTPHRN